MNTNTTFGLNTQFLIFISLLISFNIIMFYIINRTNLENFPFGSYSRSNTYGRTTPRSRDRDEPEDNLGTNVNSVDEIQQIDTNLDTGNYKWNGNINFPYGGFTYDRTYPVYPAPNICNPEKPYYSTLEGKCISVSPEEINAGKQTMTTPPIIQVTTPSIL
jgi:hypothetical protein